MVPDSSLRYLLAIDQRSQHSAFRTHLDFIEGKPVVPLTVSFKRILSTQFYEYINRRLINVRKLERLAIPNLTVKELDRPASEIAKKDFVIISKEATLADVVKRLKETKCEIVIVQDKNNRIIGTISPADLMQYLDTAGGLHART